MMQSLLDSIRKDKDMAFADLIKKQQIYEAAKAAYYAADVEYNDLSAIELNLEHELRCLK